MLQSSPHNTLIFVSRWQSAGSYSSISSWTESVFHWWHAY